MTFSFKPDFNAGLTLVNKLTDNISERLNDTREQVLQDIVKKLLGKEAFDKITASLAYSSNQSHAKIFKEHLWQAGYQLEIAQIKDPPNEGAMSKEIIRVYKVEREVEICVGLSHNLETDSLSIRTNVTTKKANQ